MASSLKVKRVNSVLDPDFAAALQQKGVAVEVEFAKKAEKMEIHPDLMGAMISLAHLEGIIRPADKTPDPSRFLLQDPYDAVTRKLGYRFPKKGMSTYFVMYVITMSSMKHLQGATRDLDKLFANLQTARIAIENLTGSIEAAESLVDLMLTLDLVDDAVALSELLYTYQLGVKHLEAGEQVTIAAQKVLRFNLGYLGMLEELPDGPNTKGSKLGTFIWNVAGSATRKDFERVRGIADKFLEASNESSMIMDLIAKAK